MKDLTNILRSATSNEKGGVIMKGLMLFALMILMGISMISFNTASYAEEDVDVDVEEVDVDADIDVTVHEVPEPGDVKNVEGKNYRYETLANGSGQWVDEGTYCKNHACSD